MRKATVKEISLAGAGRTLVVSDVHGCLPVLRGLLDKAGFGREDTLILLGDLLEKGPESLATLRYVMALSRTHTVYSVCGNCDVLLRDFLTSGGERDEAFFRFYYTMWGRRSLLWQMCREAGLPLKGPEDLKRARAELPERFRAELDFLWSMPTILSSQRFWFVHGGLPREEGLEELDAWACMKNDDFLRQDHPPFRKWVVVGHWPVTLYREVPDANPIVDRRARVVSIDGGCGVTLDGQLNALVLPPEGSEAFTWISHDLFPQARALDRQEEGADPVYVLFGQHEVEVLAPGEELSLCRHVASGRELPILTDYLYRREGKTWCEDATDHRLAVAPGETLSVLRRLSDRALVKKRGVTGWYFGRLSGEDHNI